MNTIYIVLFFIINYNDGKDWTKLSFWPFKKYKEYIMKHLQRAISLVLAVLMVFGTAISLAAPEDGDLNREFNLTNDKLVEILVEGYLKAELEQPILNPLVKSDLDGASLDLFWQVEEEGIWRKALDGEVFEEDKDYRLAVNVSDLKIQDKEIEGLRLVSENNSNQVILKIDRESFSEKEELNFDEKNAKDTNKTETTETIEETKEEAQEPKDQLIFDNKTESEDLEDKGENQDDLNADLNSDENQGEENEEEVNETIDLLVSDDQREENPAANDEETTDETSNEESESQIAYEKPIEIIDDQKQNEEAEIIEISPEKEADRQETHKAESIVSFTAYSEPMKVGASGQGVYLDGQNGDDSKDGTSKENAVKTFSKAKSLAEANNSDIIVVGTVTIKDEQELTFNNGHKVLRGENFNNYLFEITGSSANVTLKDITIDGDSDKNKEIVESLMKVTDGATLNITEGAVLKNNKIKYVPVLYSTNEKHSKGGALYVSGSILNMSAGIVENCQATYGGGIYLQGSTMNFTGGTVQNNESKRVIDKSYGGQIYSAGGGICTYNGSTIKMSGSALVQNNKAGEIGGGISLGANQAGGKNVLEMNGGVIDRNVAGSSGGGIFVQASLDKSSYGKATITAGYITNNKMDGSGLTLMRFGGAGIYVNGMPEKIVLSGNPYYGRNGELYLKNAIITDNESALDVPNDEVSIGKLKGNHNLGGAGLAVCPVSNTKIYIKDGAAIYNNTGGTGNKGKDFYLYSDKNYPLHGGEPQLKLSDYMLGAFPYKWTDENDKEVIGSQYDGNILDGTEIRLNAGNSMPEDAKKALGKVFITGNYSASRGGGIGSNGTVIIGTDDELIDVLIEKKWEDGTNPEEVEVEVGIKTRQGSYVVQILKLNNGNKFQAWIKDLPATIHGEETQKLIYVKELSDKYEVKVSEPSVYTEAADEKSEVENDDEKSEKANKKFLITVTNKKKDTPELEISGTKTWSDFGAENRPEFITVRLFANEKEVAVKEVRASDDWKYDFGKHPALDDDGKEISYTIKEDPVPGYYTTINGFDIINSREPYEPTPEYVNIRVNKRWIDNDNRNNTRPGSITIELLADGRVVDRATINSANDWGLTFFNMPKYDGGHLIDYTIREVPVEGYRSILTGDMHYGFTLTNELKGEKINIPVRKVWEGKKGAFANVSLYADGEIVYTVSLSDENNWEYIFEDLERYDANGREIVYTISEASIEGYESKIEGDKDRGFVVTNKSKESPKISIPLKKNWVGKKAEKAIVNLYANGEIVYTADLSEENAWSFVFEDLDKLDQNGNEITYTVEEVPIDGYQVSLSGSAGEGFVLTNTWTPEENPPKKNPPKDNPPGEPGLPKTGDGLNKSVYAAMVAIFGGVMVLLGLNEMRRTKRVYEEEKQ